MAADVQCVYVAEPGETRRDAKLREYRAMQDENDALVLERDSLKRELDGLRAEKNKKRRNNSGRNDEFDDMVIAVTGSPLDGRLSLQSAARLLVPHTLNNFELELMLSKPNAYAYQDLPDFDTLRAIHGKRLRDTFGDLSFATE